MDVSVFALLHLYVQSQETYTFITHAQVLCGANGTSYTKQQLGKKSVTYEVTLLCPQYLSCDPLSHLPISTLCAHCMHMCLICSGLVGGA